jgi:ubiquinone/menaquinone biosynthesis C-methylase UbiE
VADSFVPALRFGWLTRLYDPVIRATMREDEFRGELVSRVAAGAGSSLDVLDIGCGTGSLLAALRRELPGARLTGADADPGVLEQAAAKLAGDDVALVEARAGELPFPDASFDRIASSLVLHHLPRDVKRAALADARRLLRPGGRLHIADWGRATDPLMRAAFLSVQALDGFANTGDNAAGLIPRLVAEAGFVDVRVSGSLRTVLGTVEYVDAAV